MPIDLSVEEISMKTPKLIRWSKLGMDDTDHFYSRQHNWCKIILITVCNVMYYDFSDIIHETHFMILSVQYHVAMLALVALLVWKKMFIFPL